MVGVASRPLRRKLSIAPRQIIEIKRRRISSASQPVGLLICSISRCVDTLMASILAAPAQANRQATIYWSAIWPSAQLVKLRFLSRPMIPAWPIQIHLQMHACTCPLMMAQSGGRHSAMNSTWVVEASGLVMAHAGKRRISITGKCGINFMLCGPFPLLARSTQTADLE